MCTVKAQQICLSVTLIDRTWFGFCSSRAFNKQLKQMKLTVVVFLCSVKLTLCVRDGVF